MQDALSVLLKLPGAQAITPNNAAQAIILAVQRDHFLFLLQLQKSLPAAQQLPSRALCTLLLQMMKLGWSRFVPQFAGQVTARHLAPGDALWLLQQMLEHLRSDEFDDYLLQDLAGMELGRQLTGNELLQLLQQALKRHTGGSSPVYCLLQLAPAVSNITDMTGVAAFLQAAMDSHFGWDDMESLAQQLPAVQQLAPETVAELICKCISRGHGGYDFLLKHPAVSSFSTALVEEVLLKVVQQRNRRHRNDVCLADFVTLLTAPAAAQLSTRTVETLLRHAVQELWHDKTFIFGDVQQQLLALPAVQQLSADAMADILAAAARAGNTAAVSSLCVLPVAQQLSKEAAEQLLLLALQHAHFRVVQRLQELPQLQDSKQQKLQPTSEQLHQLLRVALDRYDSEAVILLCQFAASQTTTRLEPQAMQQLLVKALHRWLGCKRNITDQAAEQLFSMRDAHAVTAAAATELLYDCVSERSAAGISQLVALLPAVEHITQQDAERLVLAAVNLYKSRELRSQQLQQALLQLPAVQWLRPEAAVRLLTAGYKQQLPLQQLQELYEQLTNAKGNDVAHAGLRQLLLLSFEQQRWDVFDWLKALPFVACCAAAGDDDVALRCELRILQMQASIDI
jgi:hypothetical protein